MDIKGSLIGTVGIAVVALTVLVFLYAVPYAV